MPLPTAREFLAVVGFTSFIVCYCPAVLCSRLDRHRMTMMVEGEVEVENGEEGGGFHVIVPGVRFCTAGRLLGAALPTAATTAAIMCGKEQREDATEAPVRPSFILRLLC